MVLVMAMVQAYMEPLGYRQAICRHLVSVVSGFQIVLQVSSLLLENAVTCSIKCLLKHI